HDDGAQRLPCHRALFKPPHVLQTRVPMPQCRTMPAQERGMPIPEIRLHVRSAWQHIKPWVLAFGFWTLLGLSYAASAVISSLNEGGDPSWSRSLGWNLTNFY